MLEIENLKAEINNKKLLKVLTLKLIKEKFMPLWVLMAQVKAL